MMPTITAESTSDKSDGGCVPASKPMNGTKRTNAIARMGNTIAITCGFVFAVIASQNSVGSKWSSLSPYQRRQHVLSGNEFAARAAIRKQIIGAWPQILDRLLSNCRPPWRPILSFGWQALVQS